jgi:hypothetical protein
VAFRGRIAFALLNAQLIDQTMQISACNAEIPCAFGLTPARLAESAHHQAAFEAAHFILVGVAEVRLGDDVGNGNRHALAAHGRGQMHGVHGLIF